VNDFHIWRTIRRNRANISRIARQICRARLLAVAWNLLTVRRKNFWSILGNSLSFSLVSRAISTADKFVTRHLRYRANRMPKSNLYFQERCRSDAAGLLQHANVCITHEEMRTIFLCFPRFNSISISTAPFLRSRANPKRSERGERNWRVAPRTASLFLVNQLTKLGRAIGNADA